MDNNIERSCGGIVVNDKKQVLMVKHNLGHYGFPKGHIMDGESNQECAIREIKEETNIDVDIVNDIPYKIAYLLGNNKKKEVLLYICKAKNSDIIPQDSEIAKVMWVDIKHVYNYLEFEDLKELWGKIKMKVGR